MNLAPADAPDDLVFVRVDIPDEVAVDTLTPDALPANWNAWPYPSRLNAIGDFWIESASTVGLLVPSAVLPQERNLLINPVHADFLRLQFHPAEPFEFDRRMWK